MKSFKKNVKKMREKFAGNKKVRIFAAQFGNDPWVRTRIQVFDLFRDGCKAGKFRKRELPDGNDRKRIRSPTQQTLKRNKDSSLTSLKKIIEVKQRIIERISL